MGNIVGSLSKKQQSVIIGSLLGDGYVRQLPGRSDAFLEINHSWKAKEYVDWKYSILKNFVISPPIKRNSGSNNREAYRFFTKQHPDITKLYNKFYKNGRKIIPKDITLDSLSLAIWFMDDGSRSGTHSLYLNTQQFSMPDQRQLLFYLRQLGLKARLNKDKKYYRIRFLNESIQDLNALIRKHVIPSMQYKLDMTP